MNAGNYKFHLTLSTLYHLWLGGTRFTSNKQLTIPRTVLIIDVSKWQGIIDFVKMKSEGVDGVIIKCGQGTTKDPFFDANWENAKAAGLLRGSYWFIDSRYSPHVQAYYWNEWTKADRGELVHVPDYEEVYGGTFRGWQNLKTFIVEFQRLSQLPDDRIVIYTGYYYWIANSPTNTTDLAWFGNYALWLAWYTTNPANVIIPRPWDNTQEKFWGWQYGTQGVDGQTPNGIRYGCQSIELDESNYNGTVTEYHDQYGEILSPPPNGEPMKYTATALADNTRTRPEANVNRTYLSSHPRGTRFDGELLFIATSPTAPNQNIGDKWLMVEEINDLAVATVRWVAITHLGQPICSLVENVPPPPPPPPDTEGEKVIYACQETFPQEGRMRWTVRRNNGETQFVDYPI